jgi:hypothetical protein
MKESTWLGFMCSEGSEVAVEQVSSVGSAVDVRSDACNVGV